MAAGAYVTDTMTDSDYVTLGVATCFQRTGSKLSEVLVLEPLPASAVDCIARLGVPTSYRRLFGIKLGDLSDKIAELPEGVIKDGEQVAHAENFTERLHAAARTFRRSPEIAALIAPGAIAEVNHSVKDKRILNEAWEPSFDDNVKQDMSIDVYNRDSDIDNVAVKDLYNA